MRVVVVEDDQGIRDLISLYILDAATVVATFASATVAQSWEGWPDADLAILDFQLPGMTGAGLCAWLASAHPHVFRILTSAQDPKAEDRRTAHMYIDKTNLVEGLQGLLAAVRRLVAKQAES